MEQIPRALDSRTDDIEFRELAPAGLRMRQFWARANETRAVCREIASASQVIHAGVGNIFQPYPMFGFNAGVRMGVTTVFVMDGDIVTRITDGTHREGMLQRLKSRCVARVYERTARTGVRRASLVLLKGGLLHERYGAMARRTENFYDTSFTASDIITSQALEAKIAAVMRGERLKCVIVGRLVALKHIDQALRAMAIVAAKDGRVALDLIGCGPDEERLRRLCDELKLNERVNFCGSRGYGPELLRELWGYHVQLFTSIEEETPRALFDGMAAGCALLAYRIPFVREVAALGGHAEVADVGRVEELADLWLKLDKQRDILAARMKSAANTAPEHTAESWYRRRAMWTIEAYEKDELARRTGTLELSR
jgi:hypothetical protein